MRRTDFATSFKKLMLHALSIFAVHFAHEGGGGIFCVTISCPAYQNLKTIAGTKKVHAYQTAYRYISKLFIRNPEYRFWYVDNFG